MSESVPEPPEFYFDVLNGTLLVGKLAVDAQIESGAHPADIYRLPELLCAPERIVDPKYFDPIPYSTWNPENDVPVIQWLQTVVSQFSPQKRVSQKIVERAGHLNLVPRIGYFTSRPGHLSGLLQEATLRNRPPARSFENWTINDFVSYIKALALKIGDMPSKEDMRLAAQDPNNPSRKQMTRSAKVKIGQLYSLAGYALVKTWEKEDYIDWGVRFMKANNGRMPSERAMNFLSKTHRAPSSKIAFNPSRFAGVMDFQTQVLEAYLATTEMEEERRQHHLDEMKHLIENDSLFSEIISKAPHEQRALQHFAKYQLIKQFVPDIPPTVMKHFAPARDIHKVIELILSYTDAITAADIEVQASAMGLYDILWPMDDYLKALRVPHPLPKRRKPKRKANA